MSSSSVLITQPSLASDTGPGDAAVVFDFFRYRRQVTNATRVFADAGAAIVAMVKCECRDCNGRDGRLASALATSPSA